MVNSTVINNTYNNYSSGKITVDHEHYANRAIAGAVTAVPRAAFVNARPVRHAAIHLDRKAVTAGEIMRVAPVAPSARSVIGAGTVVKTRPSHEVIDRRVIARNAPPPVERPFAAREQQLQRNPGRAPELNTAEAGRSHDKATRNIRVIGEQRGAVNARDAGSRRGRGKSGTPSATPGQLQPLNRPVHPANGSRPGTDDQSRDKDPKGQSDAQEQRRRRAGSEQNTADQRKADGDQKAADQQQAEHQRQVDTQQQEQRRRKADSERKTADQRKADSKQKAADQQQAEQQRQVDIQQQEQRRRKADSERKTADQRKAGRQRKAGNDQKAADQQQAEQQRQVDIQQQEQRQTECEQEAIRLHQDVHQCLPTESPGHQTTDKNRK
jgi:hypothetical protein